MSNKAKAMPLNCKLVQCKIMNLHILTPHIPILYIPPELISYYKAFERWQNNY